MLLEILELTSKVFLLLIGFYSLNRLWNSVLRPSLVAPILAVFMLFFWVPSLLDLLIGVPEYGNKFSGFQVSSRNVQTQIIYNIYTSFILILFLSRLSKKRFRIDRDKISYILRKLNNKDKALYLICAIPAFLLFFVDDPKMYLVYRAVNPDYEIPQGALNSILLNSTILAAIAGSVLIFIKLKISKNKYRKIESIIVLLLIFMAVFLNGKRFIIPVILISFGSVFYYYGVESKTKLLRMLMVIGVLFVLFIVSYGKNMTGEFNETYTRLRIDFGRDDVTKYTIYEMFVNRGSILEYPMQSFLFNFTFFVPREIWDSKPYPYAVYLTSGLLGFNDVRTIGWTMTTSIFEECLSNMSYLGFIFPFIYMHIVEKINKLNMVSRFLGVLFMLMLIVVQFSAMNILFILFVLTLLKRKNNEKTISHMRA